MGQWLFIFLFRFLIYQGLRFINCFFDLFYFCLDVNYFCKMFAFHRSMKYFVILIFQMPGVNSSEDNWMPPLVFWQQLLQIFQRFISSFGWLATLWFQAFNLLCEIFLSLLVFLAQIIQIKNFELDNLHFIIAPAHFFLGLQAEWAILLHGLFIFLFLGFWCCFCLKKLNFGLF